MFARATRRVTVGVTATQIRDITQGPIANAIYRYSSVNSLQIGPVVGLTFGTGQTVDSDADFFHDAQNQSFFAIASAGTITLEITEFER